MSEEVNTEKIDIKEVLDKFVRGEEPEMSQKEAIEKYQEIKKSSGEGDSSESTEEQEHLQRIKQELLAALARVEKLEKELFGQKDKIIDAKTKLKVGNSSGGKYQKVTKEEKEFESGEKERE